MTVLYLAFLRSDDPLKPITVYFAGVSDKTIIETKASQPSVVHLMSQWTGKRKWRRRNSVPSDFFHWFYSSILCDIHFGMNLFIGLFFSIFNFNEYSGSAFEVSATPTFNVSLDSLSSPVRATWNSYSDTCLGGTFDHLHAGHKVLLTVAALCTTRRLVCGIAGTYTYIFIV